MSGEEEDGKKLFVIDDGFGKFSVVKLSIRPFIFLQKQIRVNI